MLPSAKCLDPTGTSDQLIRACRAKPKSKSPFTTTSRPNREGRIQKKNPIFTAPFELREDVAQIRVTDSTLQLNQPYREFTRRGPCRTGHRGGVQGYIAFLRGKRVTYWGRTGDQHTEWFPDAKR